ncbi:hypothetical protein ACFZAM_31685 [Streptomyces sp. NPDC008079]|uniref:hypothetical protein n=1 Tax=Streptomyces sp. NPDC008079 TaxID=3364806 RepID=UPI0036E9E366
MPLRVYDEPVPNDRQGYTVGEDEHYWYDMIPMVFNHRLVMTPKDAPSGWDWGWCYNGPVELMLAVHMWDPETQSEPIGWKKRPTHVVRVAPHAEEDPQHNRFRCIHGDYPEDGQCSKEQFCERGMRQMKKDRADAKRPDEAAL